MKRFGSGVKNFLERSVRLYAREKQSAVINGIWIRWLFESGGEKYILWRAVDSEGYELDIFLQKRRNKKSALRFLKRLLGAYPATRVIVADKLRSYV